MKLIDVLGEVLTIAVVFLAGAVTGARNPAWMVGMTVLLLALLGPLLVLALRDIIGIFIPKRGRKG